MHWVAPLVRQRHVRLIAFGHVGIGIEKRRAEARRLLWLIESNLQRLDRLDHWRDDIEEVTHDPVVGDLEDRRIGILIDGHNHL